MKVFDKTEGFEKKVNFVDENNVVLGYDIYQYCCEDADWFVLDRPWRAGERLGGDTTTDADHWAGYTFDTSYCETVKSAGDLEDCSIAIFKATRGGHPDRYVHLYNCHNGYYGHGWDWCKADDQIKSGCL